MHRLPIVPAENTAGDAAKAQGRDDHTQNLVDVTQSFFDADEKAEPSFAFVGRLIQETNFVHVERRVHFMADMWGVDVSDFLQQSKPLIEDHPYRVFVESFGNPQSDRAGKLVLLEVTDPQYQMIDMILPVSRLPVLTNSLTGRAAYNRMIDDIDNTCFDVEPILNTYRNASYDLMIKFAHDLLGVSPYSTTAIAYLIQDDWAHSQKQAAEWEAEFPANAAVIGALALKYNELSKPDKAIPLFEKYVKLAPDDWAYEDLANLYLKRGDENKWLATLTAFLSQEDYSLSHAKVQEIIARHYMATNRFDQAHSWADAAAKGSGASWAMECAAACAEGMNDFAGAENWFKQEDERYDELTGFIFASEQARVIWTVLAPPSSEAIVRRRAAARRSMRGPKWELWRRLMRICLRQGKDFDVPSHYVRRGRIGGLPANCSD